MGRSGAMDALTPARRQTTLVGPVRPFAGAGSVRAHRAAPVSLAAPFPTQWTCAGRRGSDGGAPMTRRQPRMIVATLGWILALATSASAEGTWVLWLESGDRQTFERAGAPHPRSSFPSAEDCIKAIDAQWQTWGTAEGPGHHGFHRLAATSAIMMVTYGDTTYVVTYTCLPDSIHPPEPRGGSAGAAQGWYLMMPTSDVPGPVNRWLQYGTFDSARSCQAVLREARRASRRNHEAAAENYHRKQPTATEEEVTVAKEWLKDSAAGLATTKNALCIAIDDPRLLSVDPRGPSPRKRAGMRPSSPHNPSEALSFT